MTYRLEEIASITGSTLTGRDCRIERVITDSRNPYDPAATLFVAIRGNNHDGHAFIRSLYAGGVRAFLTDTDIDTAAYPEAAARMDPHNPRRTIRALEVIEVTGRPYSASLPHYRYVIPTVQIGLDLPREELDRRIDIRTKQMLEGGFIEEVGRIRPKLGITAAKALGYQQVVDYLDGLRDLNDTFMDIAQKTKRLARKQMGWFGRDPRIHWLQALNPALLDNAMAIIEHADAGAYDAIDAQADAYTQHHLGDLA